MEGGNLFSPADLLFHRGGLLPLITFRVRGICCTAVVHNAGLAGDVLIVFHKTAADGG